MAKSIIQIERQCFVCGSPYVEEHHVIHGVANRKLSEKYGLKVWLCPLHHRDSKYGVHFDKEFDEELKKFAQTKFEETYDMDFREVFGKSYK